MAAEAPHQESTSSSTSWELQVKHGASTLALSVGAGATGAQLLDQVAAAAGTLARQLKLIHKGKVLDPGRPLAAQGVGDGAKLMALGGSTPAQGPGVTTVGAKVASAASQAKAAEVKARLEAHFGGKGGGGGGAAAGVGARAAAAPSSTAAGAQPVSHLAERQRTWRATGIMTLRELGLASLPPALLAAPGTQGPHAAGEGNEEHAAWLGWSGAIKHLDACRNVLTCVPAALGALGATLTTLKLSHNQLGDAGVPWEALASLQGLTHLALDHNQLHSLKEDGGWMHACGPRLRVLDVSHNRLSGLPAQGLAALSRLQLLQADSNQLTALPDELGACVELVELSAQDNRVAAIPAALSSCTNLQCLRLENNRVAAIPPGLLHGMSSLWLLQLGGNPLTIEQLRESDGYASLDARRRARATKQIEGRVLLDGTSAFEEGADAQQFNHWNV